MRAEDVTDTLDLALQASGCEKAHVIHKPRLHSDNGSSYVSGDLAEWLQDKGMKHSRGALYHLLPGRRMHRILPRGLRHRAKSLSGHCCAIPCRAVERWHQTLKNRSSGETPHWAFPVPSSCWKTTSYPVISKPRSKPSSTTTTTSATTRA